MKSISSFLSRSKPVASGRPRLSIDLTDLTVYAVGDVHGCLDLLLQLETTIRRDAERISGNKLIIMLGDYIDRGPASAQVIDHLMSAPPEGFERICLAGNHETAMLDYLDGRIERADWVRLGGDTTLYSYGVDHSRLAKLGNGARDDAMIRAMVPDDHVAFLKGLPVIVESPDYVFVHAGIWPDVPLGEQSDRDLTTMRQKFYAKAHLLDRFLVHGHTPITTPKLEGKRLDIDTGAYFSGRLTAVRIWRGTGRFLTGRLGEGLSGTPTA